MSWLSSIAGDVSNAFNSQPSWAKDLEIGGAAVLGGGALAGLAGIGPAAGLFAGEAGGAAAGAGAGAAELGAAGTAGAGIDFGTSSLAGLSDFGSLAGGASGGAGAGTDALALAGPETSTLAGAPAQQGITTALASAPSAGGAAPAGAAPVDFTNVADFSQGTGQVTGLESGGTTLGAQSVGGGGASGGGFNWSSLIPSASQIPGAAIAAGGLGYSIYNQNKTTSAQEASIKASETQAQNNVAAANAAAAPTLQAGETLMSYLQTGTLPQNVQTQLKQATDAAKAAAIANAARSGLSTDPTQNTALAQQLASIDQNAQTTAGTLEQQLFTSGQQAVSTANQLIASGLSSTNMQAQLQQSLITLDNQLSQQTGQAITKFAASLAPQGGAQKYTLQAT